MRSNVIASSSSFELAAGTANKLDLDHGKFSNRNKNDMKWFYENRLVDSKYGRGVYDHIFGLSTGLCPFCGISIARTLDHCLPKSKYPYLAVTPSNLVAACWDCNNEKKATVSTGNLSPYFDAWVDSEIWLQATIVDCDYPNILDFSVRNVAEWTQSQLQAVVDYATGPMLDVRFQALAVSEFQCYYEGFKEDFQRGGIGEVQRELKKRMLLNEKVRKNGWKAAAYRAWYNSSELIDW